MESDEPPADQGVFDIGSLEAELFWQKHRRTIFFSGAAAIIAVLAAACALRSIQGTPCCALFADAQNQAAWRGVIAKYPASPQQARISCLPSLCAPKEAEGIFLRMSAFLSAFPDSTLAGGAKAGPRGNLAVAAQTQGIPRSHAGAAGKGSSELCRPLCSAPGGSSFG